MGDQGAGQCGMSVDWIVVLLITLDIGLVLLYLLTLGLI